MMVAGAAVRPGVAFTGVTCVDVFGAVEALCGGAAPGGAAVLPTVGAAITEVPVPPTDAAAGPGGTGPGEEGFDEAGSDEAGSDIATPGKLMAGSDDAAEENVRETAGSAD